MSEILGEVKAKSFTLCDDAGNTRARLGMRGDSTEFSICDAGGSVRVSLNVDGAGNPSLLLADAAGNARIALEYVAQTGGALITLNSADGSTRLALGCSAEDGSARVTLLDDAGRVRMEMWSQGDDHSINLVDTSQTVRTLISEDNILLKPNTKLRLLRNEEVHK